MDAVALRSLIQTKLSDGRLPQDSIPRVWGGAGNGETCDACDEVITKVQLVMEGVSMTGGAGIQFHVMCFQIWDAERLAPGRNMSGGATVDVRNCPECGQERASVRKQEGGETRVYYQCLVCSPGWSSRRPTIFRKPAPNHAPPPGAPVAGP